MPSPVDSFNRIQQWATFGRQWWLFDAYGQDPFQTGMYLRPYLMGKHKPIYSALADCGDHVIVTNSKFIAMPGDMWERVEYFHDTGYPGGKTWTPAWKKHQEDPTEILRKAVKTKLKNNKLRVRYISRLHVFPTTEIPETFAKNISGQIRQITPLAKKLSEFSEEERNNFPRIFQFPTDFVLEPNTWYTPPPRVITPGEPSTKKSAKK